MRNLTKTLMMLAATSLLFAACGPAPSANLARSNLQRETNPNVPQTDLSTLADGNNAFALDLY